ncbi:hypothetical protein ACX80B_05235 [Arthrobacter monumenti]
MLLLVFSLVLVVVVETSILSANRGRRVSPWRNPECDPARDGIVVAVAAGMAAAGAVELGEAMGYWWTFALMAAVLLGPRILRLRHNKSVRTAERVS